MVCISGSETGKIILWEISSGKKLHSFQNNNYKVTSIAIAPDGKYFASGDISGSIKLWEVISGKLLCDYAIFDDGEWLAWKPSGEYNCSDGAYKYFSFLDDNKSIPEIVPESHPVYKAKKKEILLSNYLGGVNPYLKNPPPRTEIGEYTPKIDIDEDEIPF
jgi:WD40 repeat protein